LGAGYAGDDPVRNFADDAGVIADIEVARGVDGECVWVGQLSAAGGPAIAGGAVYAISGDGGDDAVRDFTDASIVGIRDIEIAGGIQG